jgi:hypothetical protein
MILLREREKNLSNLIRPRAPYRTVGPINFYRIPFPPVGTD